MLQLAQWVFSAFRRDGVLLSDAQVSGNTRGASERCTDITFWTEAHHIDALGDSKVMHWARGRAVCHLMYALQAYREAQTTLTLTLPL